MGNNNVISGSESSMNGDEDIAVDYQEKDEDQENNYADADNVNVEEINDSQNDINTLESPVLAGDTKVGEISSDGVGDRFGGAEDRFGGVSDFIEDAVSEEYDTEPIAPIEENQEVTTISNELDETGMGDNNNVILGSESSMNGDEDIAVDYQEKDEDQENNYADTENVNVEGLNDSQNDINTLETAVLDGDTKVGEVSLEEVEDRFSGAEDRFGGVSNLIEDAVSEEYDTEPIAPIEENQEVTNISNELDESDMVDNSNVILGSESSMNGDEDIAVDYQEEDEDQENNYADTENVNVEEIDDSQNDINTLETAVLAGDTKVGE